MSYVDSNLISGERVLYSAKMHWFIFVPGSLLVLLGIYLFTIDREGGAGPVFGMFSILFGIPMIISAWIRKLTTELAVTSKRVIAKFGLIRRSTIELNHNKVESFHVEQGIIGRILGFGTLIVNGTGGGKTPIPNIDSPLSFRREAMQAIDASQSGKIS